MATFELFMTIAELHTPLIIIAAPFFLWTRTLDLFDGENYSVDCDKAARWPEFSCLLLVFATESRVSFCSNSFMIMLHWSQFLFLCAHSLCLFFYGTIEFWNRQKCF